MTREQLKDLGGRAAHTFWQGAAATIPAGYLITDWSSAKVLLAGMVIGGGAALLSAARSTVKPSRKP